jgi:hypothetical protein
MDRWDKALDQILAPRDSNLVHGVGLRAEVKESPPGGAGAERGRG